MRISTTSMLLAVLLVLATGACDGDAPTAATAEPTAPATDPPPDWVERVYPSPGAEMSATASVQVTYERLEQDRQVRLSIDGVDVTQYADLDRVRLTYDPDDGRDVIELGPGRHTATIELVTVPAYGEQHEVVDRYSWDFTVL